MASLIAFHDAILAAVTVPNLKLYDGEIPQGDPPPLDTDNRVKPYAVLYLATGLAVRTSLSGSSDDYIDLSFQMTCVGGDQWRCLWAVDTVLTALLDRRLAVPGQTPTRIRQDGSAGPVRRDDQVSPPRFYVPLLLRVTSVPAYPT